LHEAEGSHPLRRGTQRRVGRTSVDQDVDIGGLSRSGCRLGDPTLFAYSAASPNIRKNLRAIQRLFCTSYQETLFWIGLPYLHLPVPPRTTYERASGIVVPPPINTADGRSSYAKGEVLEDTATIQTLAQSEKPVLYRVLGYRIELLFDNHEPSDH